jgi:ferredoxin-NADP reductase
MKKDFLEVAKNVRQYTLSSAPSEEGQNLMTMQK